MDIQSFILGMCAVLFISFAVGGVVVLFKVTRLEKNFNNVGFGTNQQINNLRKDTEDNTNEVLRQIEELSKEVDSRLDKQFNKIMRETNPRDRILNMIRDDKTTSREDDKE